MAGESNFQTKLIKDIQNQYPGAVILKNDPNYCQGIPDWLILYRDRWAMLEVKANKLADHKPNQDYYVDLLMNMSFASFIYPENREIVLDELQLALRPSRTARVSRRF